VTAPPPPGPAASAWGTPPAPAAAGPTLFVHYGGQRVPVTKDRFIIGRAKTTSDLAIKDPNISRQHAMIELVGGRYYIVDMGSTNGIVFQGENVSRKQILEGDRIHVGDHEIMFSYRT
jgi:pSer/pThr/pTyr-binding forkhead associated (FHA) protein